MENASDVECRRKKKVLRWRRQVMKNAKEEETEDPEIEEERELCRNSSSTWIFFPHQLTITCNSSVRDMNSTLNSSFRISRC